MTYIALKELSSCSIQEVIEAIKSLPGIEWEWFLVIYDSTILKQREERHIFNHGIGNVHIKAVIFYLILHIFMRNKVKYFTTCILSFEYKSI